ncbi:MAG: TonB-dependent receptor domain-containing protein [Acidobacteriota bacterium]
MICRHTLKFSTIACATLFLAFLPVWSQSTATLQGTVSDPGGDVVPGATVKVVHAATGIERVVLSDDTGAYVVNFLPIGKYSVSVEVAGFKVARFENFLLEIGQSRTLDVKLEVGEMQETVNVTETATPLDRNSPVIGTVIGSSQVKELPLNGRHWASLMMLAPGAINTGEGNQLSIRFVGRARDDNNWTFDGIDSTGVKDPRQETGIRLIISMDAISEFRVNSALYSAESGGGAGGNVQLVSRGGTNQFRGSVFDFLRNDVFDARVFTDPGELPPFRLNQFGVNFGGPLRKDKTFYFINYEGIRQNQGQTFRNFVPSAAYRASVTSASPALAQVVQAYPRGTAATADANIDEVVTQRTLSTREDSGVLRLDHHLSNSTSMYARYSVDDAVVRSPRDPGIGLLTDRVRPSNAVIQMQKIFSPSLINQAKVGMNRSPLTRITSGPLQEQFTVPGFMTLARNQEVVEAGTSFAFIDDLAMTRGRHNIKVGGEFRRIRVNVGEGEPVSISYSSRPDFVINRMNNFSIAPFPTRGGRRFWAFGYIQDDVKLRPNLTVNLGVRYEYYSVVHEAKDRGRVFAMECGGFCPPGTPFYEPDRNNFAPRIGLAWAPAMFHDKTVIRAGFGIFFGPGQNDDVFAAIDSSANRVSLDRNQAPSLSYPIAPFLGLAATVGAAPRALDRFRRDLYSENFGLSIQQELPAHFVAQVGYVGGQAHKLFYRSFLNVIDPATGKPPLTRFSKIDLKRNDGNSNFHGLQVSLHRQFISGFSLGAQYMWSHSINDGSVGGGEASEPQNVNDKRGNRANSAQDIRHTTTINWIYELPFGAGRRFLNQDGIVDKVFGGWELTGITQARTGRQLTVSVTRSSADLPDGNNTNQRPDRVAGVSLIPPGGQTATVWINPAAFVVPPKGRWGNSGRSIMTGPGLVQFDVGLNKRFPFAESRSVEFRAEAFNLFNRTQLGNPNTNISSGVSFGRITSPFNRTFGTGTNRQMQFMLRLNF